MSNVNFMARQQLNTFIPFDTRLFMTRQTKTFLLERFREMGIRPATRHGQNFLIDLNLVQLIIDAADITADDVVLEVGTGTGSLTALMAERAAAVVTVEIDAHLFELASEQLIDLPNVTMLQFDALRNKNNFDDRVMDAVGEHLTAAPDRRFKLVANLPYNIATPVISNLLLARHVPHSMTVTIQKELADRIIAAPSTKDYSALSVWIQSQCTAEIVRLMPPSVFWPEPKVTSAILHIVVDPAKRARIKDLTVLSPNHESAVSASPQVPAGQCRCRDEGTSRQNASRFAARRHGLRSRHANRTTRCRNANHVGREDSSRCSGLEAVAVVHEQ